MQVNEREYQQYDIDEQAWAGQHPFGISGCIRVRNDAEFVEAAVLSHLPYCDEIVLAVQPSEDDTEVICERLKNEFPDQVRVVRYPVIPRFISDPLWEQTDPSSIYSFVYMSNWALAQCRYSWIAKFEADVIALPSTQAIVDRIRAEPLRRIYYGRVILNVAGLGYDLISAKNPRNAGWDEAFFPNHPDWKFLKSGRYEAIHFHLHEHECMGWSALHMKRCKMRYWGKIDELYEPFNPAGVARALQEYNATHTWYPSPDKSNPLGDPVLFDIGWRKFTHPQGGG